MIETEQFLVGGMKCSGCEESLRQGLLELPGVMKAHPDRFLKTISVSYNSDELSGGAIEETIRKLGYRVPRSR